MDTSWSRFPSSFSEWPRTRPHLTSFLFLSWEQWSWVYLSSVIKAGLHFLKRQGLPMLEASPGVCLQLAHLNLYVPTHFFFVEQTMPVISRRRQQTLLQCWWFCEAALADALAPGHPRHGGPCCGAGANEEGIFQFYYTLITLSLYISVEFRDAYGTL